MGPSEAAPGPRHNLLEVRALRKVFPGVVALDGIDLDLRPGEIHALLGQNGAGKSTLLKIISGALLPDAGVLTIEGERYDPRAVADAQRRGVFTVFQEINLAPHLSVADNIALGSAPTKFGLLDRRAARRAAREVLARLGVDIDVRRPLGVYSAAERQLVAIARALARSARILILDEPTSSLDAAEVARLFAVLRALTASGVGILFVSHVLGQVEELADRTTIMRSGKVVGELPRHRFNRREAVNLMLGREFTADEHAERSAPADAPPVLQADQLARAGSLAPATLQLHKGEVLGLAGLLGSGRTELARLLYGADRASRGTIRLLGKPVRRPSPRASVMRGLGFSPEDRKTEGVIPGMSVQENIELAHLARRGWWRRRPRPNRDLINALGVATPSPQTPIERLSGGNQQKVLLARWVRADPVALILDEPTRGIDIGAKSQVDRAILDLAGKGVAALVINSEPEELARVCDRVLVMRDRRLASQVEGRPTPAAIVQAISAGGEHG